MIHVKDFSYKPMEHEREKASNAYLMSLVALIVGLPLPIVNLIATFIFYFGYRNASYFVRWHCIQALFSQISLVCMNGAGIWWTVSILLGEMEISNGYIAYIGILLFYNLTEFVFTIYTAIKTRDGIHVEWFFFGTLTHLLCRPQSEN